MDLYNLFVSGEKIYNQIQKSPSELTYEDYLLMMDPFFISENDIVEVERKKKRRSKRGGSEESVEVESPSGDGDGNEEGDGDDFGDDGDDGDEDGGEDGNKDSGKKKDSVLEKIKKGDFSSLSDEELAEEEAKLLEQDEENYSQTSEENEDKKDKEKKNALNEFKGNMGSFLKYFVLLLFIGGGPLIIWFVIMYFTFKRLRSTYKWMIEPM